MKYFNQSLGCSGYARRASDRRIYAQLTWAGCLYLLRTSRLKQKAALFRRSYTSQVGAGVPRLVVRQQPDDVGGWITSQASICRCSAALGSVRCGGGEGGHAHVAVEVVVSTALLPVLSQWWLSQCSLPVTRVTQDQMIIQYAILTRAALPSDM